MATNKIHYIAALTVGSIHDLPMSENEAAIIVVPDAIRCWGIDRAYSHFTFNPKTKKYSWIQFPDKPVYCWERKDIESALKFNAGKPGECCIEEETIVDAIWEMNEKSFQNKLLFLHLVQDSCYDQYVRVIIDTDRRYEDIFVFNGEKLNGSDMRGKGNNKWSGAGLLNQLDDQFYVRMAKRFYEATGIIADKEWLLKIMTTSIYKTYSTELADNTIRFIDLSDKSDQLIKEKKFDEEVWPVKNHITDFYVEQMIRDSRVFQEI